MPLLLERLRTAQRIGFLFPGGSKRCAFQVGVVNALDELGIVPSMCLGVSAGVWNAAAVALGRSGTLASYWRFFDRMPHIDLRNLRHEHSPFIFAKNHARAFRRYLGGERFKESLRIPLLVGLTRLRDWQHCICDASRVEDPFKLLLATNFLPPFYTHPITIGGEAYGDGGISNNVPYEVLLSRGCDLVVIISPRGLSDGEGLYRNPRQFDYQIPEADLERLVIIRPRHPIPVSFSESRWDLIRDAIDLGYRRTRELLVGEEHYGGMTPGPFRFGKWLILLSGRFIEPRPGYAELSDSAL